MERIENGEIAAGRRTDFQPSTPRYCDVCRENVLDCGCPGRNECPDCGHPQDHCRCVDWLVVDMVDEDERESDGDS